MMKFLAVDIHISLAAEKLFEIGPLAVTNAILYGLVCAGLLAWLLIYAAKRIKIESTDGLTQFVEILVEFVINLLRGPFGSRSAAIKYTSVFGTFFLFILLNNLMGIIPLVGPGFTVGETPLFRPFTADLNGTIALAVIAIVGVQVLSIKQQGGINHLKHYFTDKPWNPINMFIGALEVIGELPRVISLAARLFLNVAVGEMLIAIFTSLILVSGRTPLTAIPIFAFEILVAAIQAYIFTILIATYLGLSVSHAHDDHNQEPEAELGKVDPGAASASRKTDNKPMALMSAEPSNN